MLVRDKRGRFAKKTQRQIDLNTELKKYVDKRIEQLLKDQRDYFCYLMQEMAANYQKKELEWE